MGKKKKAGDGDLAELLSSCRSVAHSPFCSIQDAEFESVQSAHP
jgi:hypothetical protein